MNKYLTIILMCAPTCGLAVPSKPYEIVHGIVQRSGDDDIVAYGTHNDALIKTHVTSILRVIYAQKHDSDFWSRYTVPEMGGAQALSDYCFINFKYNSYTEYRLFCGDLSDFKSEHRTVSIHKPAQSAQTEYQAEY